MIKNIDIGSVSIPKLKSIFNSFIVGKGEQRVLLYRKMRHIPKVSCIVICYNAERYLEEALNSLFSQDFTKSFEIIILYDRGTTDKTIDKLIKILFNQRINLSRIAVSIVFHNNTTLFRARELSLKYAIGRYICFLDYDNRFHPDKLTKQIEFMRKNKLHFSFASQDLIDEQSTKIREKFLNVPRNYKDPSRMLLSGFIDANEFIFDRYFYSKFLKPAYSVLSNKIYDYGLDDYFIDCIAALSNNINYLNQVLGDYRIHKYSSTPRSSYFTFSDIDKNAILLTKFQIALFAVIKAASVLKIANDKLFFNYVSHISGSSNSFSFHFPGKVLATAEDKLPLRMFKFGISIIVNSVKVSYRHILSFFKTK